MAQTHLPAEVPAIVPDGAGTDFFGPTVTLPAGRFRIDFQHYVTNLPVWWVSAVSPNACQAAARA